MRSASAGRARRRTRRSRSSAATQQPAPGRAFSVLDRPGDRAARHAGSRARQPAPWRYAAGRRLDAARARQLPHQGRLAHLARRGSSATAARAPPIARDPRLLRRQQRRQRAFAPCTARPPHDAIVADRPAQGRADRPDRRLDGRRRHAPLHPDDRLTPRPRLRPRRGSTRPTRAALDAAADVGVRWLLKAHPAPGPVHRPGRRRARSRPRLPRPVRRRRVRTAGHRHALGLPEHRRRPRRQGRGRARARGRPRRAGRRARPAHPGPRVVRGRRRPRPIAPELPGDFYVGDTSEDVARRRRRGAATGSTGEAAYPADAARFLARVRPRRAAGVERDGRIRRRRPLRRPRRARRSRRVTRARRLRPPRRAGPAPPRASHAGPRSRPPACSRGARRARTAALARCRAGRSRGRRAAGSGRCCCGARLAARAQSLGRELRHRIRP